MGVTTDRDDPDLKKPGENGQQKKYLVLSREEYEKGFVRPYRTNYVHVGLRPKHPLRDLTEEEKERYSRFGYVKFEAYPESESRGLGRYWTQEQLDRKGCGYRTTMNVEIAATYARDPKFYGGTFCVHCRTHFPVAEFRWVENDVETDLVVGE